MNEDPIGNDDNICVWRVVRNYMFVDFDIRFSSNPSSAKFKSWFENLMIL